MGEWKRVFLNRGRIGLLFLLTVLSAALFAGSLMQRIGPGEFQRALALGRYKGELTERWKNETPSEILRLAQEEEALLTDYYYYINDYPRWDSEGNELPPVFTSREEADLRMAEHPYLLSLVDDELMFSETLWMHIDALHEVEADAEYIEGYEAYLQKIQKQAEDQSKTSIFGKQNSFSMRNLKKTAKEFGKLLGIDTEGQNAEEASAVQVRFGNNTGIEKWLAFTLGDYFGLLCMIVFVMAFLEERKKGLWSTIRTTRKGRAALGVHRAGILLVLSALCTVLLNAFPLYLSVLLNGGHTDFSRAIQSVQSFRTCTIRTTVGGWLLRYLLIKTLSGFFLGLFVWLIMGAVSNSQLSLAALAPILGAEYALFRFLPVQSIFNVFKYLNLFSYVHTAAIYTNYLNIDLFSFPVGNRQMMLLLLPVLLVVFCFLCIRMQAKRYPEGNRDILSKLSLKLNTLLDAPRRHFTAGMWEAWKVLFLQYGIVIMVIMVIASLRLSYSVWSPIPEDRRTYYMYVQDVQGPIDENTDAYLLKARENAAESGNSYALLSALDMLEQRIGELRAKGEKEGFAPYILYDQDFNAYYGETPKNRQRLNAMIAMLFVVFLTAGISSFERQSGVVPMLRSLNRGRKKLLAKKIVTALILAVFAWGLVYMRELWQYLSRYGAQMAEAPIRNFEAFSDFPLNLSIRGYLILLYGLRLLMLFMTAYAVLFLSSFLPNVRTAYLAVTAVLILPALFAVLGIGFFVFISPLIPVSSAELLLSMGAGKWYCALPFIAWLLLGHGALLLYRRRWVRT